MTKIGAGFFVTEARQHGHDFGRLMIYSGSNTGSSEPSSDDGPLLNQAWRHERQNTCPQGASLRGSQYLCRGREPGGLTLEAWSWYQCIFDIEGMFQWWKQAVGRSLNISGRVGTVETYIFMFTRFRFQQLVLQLLFFLRLGHWSEWH